MRASRCWPATVLGARGREPSERARSTPHELELLEALAARAGWRSSGRGCIAPALSTIACTGCRRDRRARAGADAAGGRGDGGGAGRRGARRQQRLGGAAGRATGARSSSHTPPATAGRRGSASRSLPLDAELPLAEAARTATPLWLESAEAIFGAYPRFREVRPQAQSAALLPLADGGVALGAIGLVFDFRASSPPTTATTCSR